MPTQITALAVSKAFDGRPVLDSVTCSLAQGERTGIVGENGSGKTTLLRLLAGRESPDRGRVVLRADGGVGYLAQDEVLPADMTAQQVIDRALGDLRAIEGRMRRLEAAMADGDASALDAYGEAVSAFELRGGYDADARLERVLHGLGLRQVDRASIMGALSGGERARLRLASVLAAAPEVLLLDEPTNHLDEAALTWLEGHLRSRRGTTVVVSHDRGFLEQVATSLLEVDGDRHGVVRYGNGYAGYLAEKAAARRRWGLRHDRWREEVDRLRDAVAVTARRVAPGRPMKDGDKLSYNQAGARVQQSLAGRVRNAEERLSRLLAHPVPAPPDPLSFSPVLHAGQLHGTVLDAVGIAVAGRLDPVDLTVRAGEHLLITGGNGAGKSTLLSVLAGESAPDRGHVVRRGRIGCLPQDPAPGPPDETLLAAYARGLPGEPDEHAERLLALGLFDRARLSVPVGRLSTGQRQRLALARLVGRPADILLLDEPTNHLSLDLAEELEAALAGFAGAVVLVSHDRLLRRRWRGAHLALRPARVSALSD
ncbi:ATP-binding cassette domain-containing protein [Streptomyces filamentosus]|uniref:ATP-binding cassette domain-containing protein n=2 Tax=Streptomyces filamentosus TaxID=67294 RepID=A0ABY4UPP3_STRFL|nr:MULTISPECIES: ABC-F family ATP-binding cassette domain-containing protein [Streptomyces]EFE78844.1 antibiotic resistance protein [Streptomyces filamentosus NRRL 15998]ESU46113.1 putative ABC transporter ATP-binding protein [Streptomyces sp. HCCB10043]EWS95704.1 antibiotic resistance protein [Streptomyces filamentosus NRRL 11379]MYR82695.1 ATP-binding cassette domain-containing protein [Streptomyces sp. SID5466]USC45864.1 ATP-binding cassette domain-containing protein [Streptomyces filamento